MVDDLDLELSVGLRANDPRAFERLMERYGRDVYAVVAAVLPGRPSQDIEDAASDAFLAAWRGANAYDPGRASVRTWLLMHARYAALGHRRQARRRLGIAQRAFEEARASVPEGPGPEDRQQVQGALAQLARGDREILYRRYILDQDGRGIADAMNLTRSAVDNRLSRARQRLRGLLDHVPEAAEGGAGDGR